MADNRLIEQEGTGTRDFLPFEIDNSTITYLVTAQGHSAQSGLAVRLVPGTDNTVELVGDGEAILGKLISVTKDLGCVVQVTGPMTLPTGTSATTTEGYALVGDLLVAAEGYVRESDGATATEIQGQRGKTLRQGQTTTVGNTTGVTAVLAHL